MKSKPIIILFAIMVMSVSLFAELNSTQAFGVHFGTLTSSGYAMRFMGEKHGLQFTLGAYTLGNNEPFFDETTGWYEGNDYTPDDTLITIERGGRASAINAGINYLYTLDHFKGGRFYILSGGSYQYYQRKIFEQDYLWGPCPDYDSLYCYNLTGTEREKYKVEHRWTVGAGPGIEIALSKQLRIAVEIPITYNWKNDIVMWIPQAGIYYYFK
jgi:hypothetical protein